MGEPQGYGMGMDVFALVRDGRDQILREMSAGFAGVHHRQDIANGRTAKLEQTAARLDERVEAVCERLETVERENEAFHVHRRSTDPPPEKTGDDRRISQRDVWLVGLGAAGAFGLFKLLPWLIALGHVKP